MLVGPVYISQKWAEMFGHVVMVNTWLSLMDRRQKGLPELHEDLEQKAFL